MNDPLAGLRAVADQAPGLLAQELWYRGDLRHLCMEGGQTEAYDFVHSWSTLNPGHPGPLLLELHRGAGKTALLLILDLERCLTHPGETARAGGPTLKQSIQICREVLPLVLQTCPHGLRPEAREGGARLEIKNPRWPMGAIPSTLHVIGCKEEAGAQRGLRSNLITLDELREFDSPQAVVEDVFMPHFLHRDRPLMVIASTPPKVPGHYFNTLLDRAMPEGRCLTIPSSRNTGFAAADRRKLLAVYGSEDCVAWRREMECHRIADLDALVLPSFSKNKTQIVQAWPRPTHFYPFSSLDIGFVDASGAVFAYIDFLNQQLVVEEEFCKTSQGTLALVSALQEIEHRLFAGTPHASQIRRWADADPRALEDMRQAGLAFSSCKSGEKLDKWAPVALLESLFAQCKVKIHPRCRNLIYQLENAAKNKHHTDIQRLQQEGLHPDSPIASHFDCLHALAYLANKARSYWLANPFPTEARGYDQVLTPGGGGHGAITNHPLEITRNSGHVKKFR
ncbi:MAG: hypothetical protein ACRDV9_06010 [Acidimicrobiia bacterium]